MFTTIARNAKSRDLSEKFVFDSLKAQNSPEEFNIFSLSLVYKV